MSYNGVFCYKTDCNEKATVVVGKEQRPLCWLHVKEYLEVVNRSNKV